MRPVGAAELSSVTCLLTDVDGTLTGPRGRIEAETVRALERLSRAGLYVALVTGRPSGYAEAWARSLPVRAVISENGGLYHAWRRGRLVKVYAQEERERRRARQRLVREVRRVLRRFPEAALSSDSVYAEVDLAIDWAEARKLPIRKARRIQAVLQARGVNAVRSSVHVNCWVGSFDKRSTSFRLLGEELGLSREEAARRTVYVGDSLNDAPMFEGFPRSVGVANVLDVLDELQHPPAFVTRRREGRGFRELVRALLWARRWGG